MAKSRHFRRDGADIHSDALITLSQAILGGTIRIPGIHGDILLTVSGLIFAHSLDSEAAVCIMSFCDIKVMC